MLWIAALVEGAGLLDDPGLLATARRAGDHYAGFVEDAFIYGAPEDVHLAPTSEDAYNALIAYVALHEADGDGRWLRLGQRAADWMMTFRWTYNVAFDPRTLLGRYDFRSRGADQASPSNQHLHAYGLICLGELARLWRLTGDDHYVQRARTTSTASCSSSPAWTATSTRAGAWSRSATTRRTASSRRGRC